jgi:hypothetical protein
VDHLNAPSPAKDGYDTHPSRYPSTAWTQNSAAEIQLRLSLMVFLLLIQGNILIITAVIMSTYSERAERAEQLAVSRIESTNPIDVRPSERLVGDPHLRYPVNKE